MDHLVIARAGGRGTARRDGALALVAAGVVCAAVAATVSWGGDAAGEAVLAALAGAALVGVACAAVARRPGAWSGPADRVTLVRTVLGGGVVTVVVVDLLTGSLGPSWPVVLLAVPALVLDGVDGAVARRTGTASDAGARLDMEVDAALILVLCVPAAAVVGPWVLAGGLMRYAWVALGAVRPALRGSLAPSLARKAVAAAQGVVLVAVVLPGMPPWAAVALAAAALAALVWSFGRDGFALERAGARRP